MHELCHGNRSPYSSGWRSAKMHWKSPTSKKKRGSLRVVFLLWENYAQVKASQGKCYPTVGEEYKVAVENYRRKLRGFIVEAHLLGEAVYVDDIPSPTNWGFGAFIYSTKPLARVKNIRFISNLQSHRSKHRIKERAWYRNFICWWS